MSTALRLEARSPFRSGELLDFLAARAVPGLEEVAGNTYTRSIPGLPGPIVLELPRGDSEPVVTVDLPLGSDAAEVTPRIRRLLDMDAQPGEIDAALSGDPALRPHVESAPGLRVPGAVEGFEMAVRAIVGQQVSVAGARTTLSGIVSRLGEPIAAPLGSVTHRFPTPSRLVAATDEDLRMPATRVQAIRTLSGMVLEGALDLDGGSDPAEATASLLTIRGVGPWTAAYVAMRALHDPDAFPEGDLGIRRGAASLGFSDGARLLRARAERWRPWRSYAAVHLWRANG